jgi:predicted ATPase
MPNNAISAITIRGFKSIAAIESLELRPINVVIGANGAGKSNFVGVFSFLAETFEEPDWFNERVSVAGGANRLLHFGSKRTAEIEIVLAGSQRLPIFEVRLVPTADDRLLVVTDHIQLDGSTKLLPDRSVSAAVWIGRQFVQKWRVFHLNDTSTSSPLRRTGRVDDNRYLRSDASNLAAFLYLLKQKHPDSYALICRTVRQVAPFFDDFQLEPLALNSEDIKLEWRHKGSDEYFNAADLSDGTLRFMALATLLLQPVELRPSLILIDEPELGLHPAAIELLAALIRRASVDTQVIVATQSTLLLDQFDPEDVLVAERVNGGTQLKRLNSEDLRSWLEDYSLGQLWEKNEFGGQPVTE